MAARPRTRPDNIQYWTDEVPPPSVSLLAAFQQFGLIGSIMALEIVFAQKVGLSARDTAALISMTMLAAGIGVCLQAMNRFGIGSGLFIPMHTSGAAFLAMEKAIALGGFGLAFGMMTVVGGVQLLAGKVLHRARFLLSVEIGGLAVFLIGTEMSLLGVEAILAEGERKGGAAFAASALTLAVMVLMSVWMRGPGRSFAVFVGMLLGQAAAWWFGLLPSGALAVLGEVEAFALPRIAHFGWAMDWRLLPDFVVVGLVLCVNCYAITIVAQRASDAGWRRPDVPAIRGSLTAEGIANVAGSLLNGVAQASSGPAVGLSQSSGIVSRRVAYFLGALFAGMSFFPPVAMMWSLLSGAVFGPVLLFVGGFILIAGLKILTSRLLDERKTITLSVAFVGGLAHEQILHYLGLSGFVHADAVFVNSLTTAVIIALSLHLLFLLGSGRRRLHDLAVTEGWHERLNQLVWNLGRRWGGRPEVVARLEDAANHAIDALVEADLIEGEKKVRLAVVFDEADCALRLSYRGKPLKVPEKRPGPEELLENPDAVQEMAGYLIRRLSEEMTVTVSQRAVRIELHFRDD